MGVSKTNDHIQMKIKMPKPIQEPPKLKAQSKAKSLDQVKAGWVLGMGIGTGIGTGKV